MNKRDMKIIAQLRRNSRLPLTTLSRRTSIPVSTIFDRLKLNKDGIITRHTCLLDFSKLGYPIRANIILKVDREDKDAIKEYLVKHHLVNSVYRINNGFDFMVEGVFKQIEGMEDFIDHLEKKFKITDAKSFFIIKDLKREAFMSDPDLIFDEKPNGGEKNESEKNM